MNFMYMKVILLIFTCLVFTYNSYSQECCVTTVLVQYDTLEPVVKKRQLTLMFNSGFEGLLEVSLNGKVIERKNVVYIPGVDNAEVRFQIAKNKVRKGCLLKVKTANECMQLPLDWRYNSLRISKAWGNEEDVKWYLIYTNQILTRE